VTITPEQAIYAAGSGTTLKTKAASNGLNPSTVRLEVEGIGVLRELASIGPWTFERKLAEERVGHERGPVFLTGADAISNLVLTLAGSETDSSSGIARLSAWLQDVVVKGEEDDKRTAVLTVSGARGSKLELKFTGLMPRSHSFAIGAGSDKHKYELVAEGVKLISP
jgi:hypothetical protein